MAKSFVYGRNARLFPTVKSEEDRATSILLATMTYVDGFRRTLMKTTGQTVSKRGNDFSVCVHPQFGGKDSPKDIPDGMITVRKGGNEWNALIEVKIKKADLDQGQLERYLHRAVENTCDALITISNEMCRVPEEPPLRLISREREFKKITYYHWSWKFILHTAESLLVSSEIENPTQKQILSELVLFLRDSKSGVSGFTSMNRQWKDFVATKKVGGRPSQQLYEDVVSDWHQETAELAIILENHLERTVAEVVPKPAIGSPEKRLKHDVEHLQETGDLLASFSIKGLSHKLNIALEVDQRSLHFSIARDLSDKVKTPYKRIERFLRTLQEGDEETGRHDNVHLFVKWPRQKIMTDTTLFDALQDMIDGDLQTSKLINQDKDAVQHVILKYTPSGMASAIQSPTKIISRLESDILYFCDHYLE